jgi:UDP-N-acetylglucosamine 2-epimerase (non-hydrolysing)
MKIASIIGTRPEIIKMLPVIKELQRRNHDLFIINTGQHYSYNMDGVFFEQLQIPEGRYNLKVGSDSQAEQTAKVLIGVEKVLLKESPDIVLVEGDTNSVLAGSLVAVKLHIKVGHIEAGLRSYDRKMPEEINRILVDHCSDFLFAPTKEAMSILLKEGCPANQVFMTGNTIVDAVKHNLEMARKRESILASLNLKPREYFLTTIHRQENADSEERFASILKGLSMIHAKFHMPVIYPIHPRAEKMIGEFGLSTRDITLIEPVDYLGFLQLESNAKLILTDSGGIQEEACILGIPCVTLRDNTERPETIEVGANILAGTSPDRILDCTDHMLKSKTEWEHPFGDGTAAKKIVDILEANP